MIKFLTITFFAINSLVFTQNFNDLNGLSNDQLDDLRSELNNNQQENFQVPVENNTVIIPENTNIAEPNINENFGYEYFKKNINFFDNIPTPNDYKLGPGDEIILSLWGETNSREVFVINKDGAIYYQNIGFINLSNMTLSKAEDVLENQLSRIYSTMNDSKKPTKLSIELGRIKSLNVYFTGEIANPGINLVHPFSDIFAAIIQAGGISDNGSLRQIKLIRDSEEIAIIDFYSFFISGNDKFSNIKILDGDIIHIPIVKNRVRIEGEVIKPKFYELLNSDRLSNLIEYAGGLSSSASQKALIESIVPSDERTSDDYAVMSNIVDLSSSNEIILENGSDINILPIAVNNTNVSVYGRVYREGEYPAFSSGTVDGEIKSSSLKKVLDAAGGFDDPVFRKSIDDNIVILRQDENQFYAREFNINIKDASTFDLEVNDKIFVYENINYKNSFSYTMEGELNLPGVYPLTDGLTLSQAITKAGGITDVGSVNSILVEKTLSTNNQNGDEIIVNEMVSNIDLEFKLSNGDIVKIYPKTNVVRVDGNVYNPGLVAHSGKMTMGKAIELAGGFMPNSLKKRSYVIRANGEIEKADLFRGKLKRVYPGDAIFVPIDPDPTDFDITQFLADISSTLANIAAILVIADNNN